MAKASLNSKNRYENEIETKTLTSGDMLPSDFCQTFNPF